MFSNNNQVFAFNSLWLSGDRRELDLMERGELISDGRIWHSSGLGENRPKKGIYLLLDHCKNLAKFRYFSLVYQIICLIRDIHLNFVWQLAPLANWTPFHYSMLIVSVLAIFHLSVLLILVVEAHKFPKTLTKIFYYFSYFFPIIFGALSETLKSTEQWDHIRKTYPDHVSSFQTLLNFSFDSYTRVFFVMCMVLYEIFQNAIR